MMILLKGRSRPEVYENREDDETLTFSERVVPEASSAVATFALALGALLVLKWRALIRKLPAIETLASITVIFPNKNGTLTRNVIAGFYLLLIVLLIPTEIAFAVHEADHRYTISGYIRDEGGNSMPRINVILEHKDGQTKKATTNRRGYYEVLFHLHNENLGDEIIVKAGDEVKKITVAFDPKDRRSERQGRVDFGAPGKASEPEEYSEYNWIYWTAAALLAISAYLVFFRKKKRQKER